MASGMIYKVHRLEAPLSPLSGYENSDSFNDYLSDTGLRNYREKYQPDYAIRFSELNFGWQDRLYSIPLYAAWCI